MSRSKGKLIVIILAFVVLAVSSLACGESDNVGASSAEPTPSQEEVEAYWEEANAKDAIRQEAIRREMIIIEWRGDWKSSDQVALFHGTALQRTVKVGKAMLDLVERDQITLKELRQCDNGGTEWITIASIPNNLQPGNTIVFIHSGKVEEPAIDQEDMEVGFSLSGMPLGDTALFIDETLLIELTVDRKVWVPLEGNDRCGVNLKIRNAEGNWQHVTSLGCIKQGSSINFAVDGLKVETSWQ